MELQVALKRGQAIIGKKTNVLNLDSLDEIRTRFLHRPSMVEKAFPFLYRLNPRTWRNKHTGEVLTLPEVIETYSDPLTMEIPKWYFDLTNKVPVGVVRTQRLFDFRNLGDPEERPTVKELVNVLSNDIKDRINAKITESAIQFQRKEKTFPHRILEGSVKAGSEHDLRNAYIALQSRIAALEAVGLQESSDSLILPKIKLNPTHKRVLTLYLSDVNENLTSLMIFT
ncbi:hypothetical protein [Burkholderia gladioli]|uniref:hypothetical protein n=1 Tax=Burkholderia gladioli TaxID=28095 RepID=UPI0012FD1658|nr:hypothetical protein [Burkholderia gladioli]